MISVDEIAFDSSRDNWALALIARGR